MKALLDFLPVLLFFIVYKFQDIYAATAVAIVASVLDEVLADKPLRLVKISISQVGAGQSLADRQPEDALQGLDPAEVFLRRYQERYDAAPSAELLEAFHELLDKVHAGGAA